MVELIKTWKLSKCCPDTQDCYDTLVHLNLIFSDNLKSSLQVLSVLKILIRVNYVRAVCCRNKN
jgi:hypothetical protein